MAHIPESALCQIKPLYLAGLRYDIPPRDKIFASIKGNKKVHVETSPLPLAPVFVAPEKGGVRDLSRLMACLGQRPA